MRQWYHFPEFEFFIVEVENIENTDCHLSWKLIELFSDIYQKYSSVIVIEVFQVGRLQI